jgi:hypothetical protein
VVLGPDSVSNCFSHSYVPTMPLLLSGHVSGSILVWRADLDRVRSLVTGLTSYDLVWHRESAPTLCFPRRSRERYRWRSEPSTAAVHSARPDRESFVVNTLIRCRFTWILRFSERKTRKLDTFTQCAYASSLKSYPKVNVRALRVAGRRSQPALAVVHADGPVVQAPGGAGCGDRAAHR